MDFFAHQDAARRRTGLLVFLMATAVAAIIAVLTLAAGTVVQNYRASKDLPEKPVWGEVLAWVAPAVLGLVALGSLYKFFVLRGGGRTIAELLGGRLVPSGSREPRERVLLNVVEEMSIASGIPVPPVYVLEDERGINALAAGLTPESAVIAVTRGALERLSRDELQGVIAHEYSHILNGDMRLSLRLIGIVHGIALIGLSGEMLLRSLRHVRGGKNSGGVIVAILTVGLFLLIVGYVGLFFAKLIKAAVSRQREFLADAAAVQFTRNPAGIGGALRKIAAAPSGSAVVSGRAEEVNHLFFGPGVSSFLEFLGTHPPLEERIRRVDPHGTAVLEKPVPRPKPAPLRRGGEAVLLQVVAAVADAGNVAPRDIAYAEGLVAALPPALLEEARDPLGAAALACGLLLDRDPAERAQQLKALGEGELPLVAGELGRIVPLLDGLPAEGRLPLMEAAAPALRALSPAQAKGLRDAVRRLIEADRKVTLFEFAVRRLLDKTLAPRPPGPARYHGLMPLRGDAAVLLSALAKAGGTDPARSYAAGAQSLREELGPPPEAGPAALDRALDRFAESSAGVKRRILEACAAAVEHDGRVTAGEAELLRVVAAVLDCPMPPLLARAS